MIKATTPMETLARARLTCKNAKLSPTARASRLGTMERNISHPLGNIGLFLLH